MSYVGALVVVAAAAVGQLDESGSTQEHMKDLQCFVGEWKFEGEEFGEKITGKTKVEWINNKSFLLVRSVTKQPDGTEMPFAEVIGWNPVTKRIQSWGFGGLGGHGQFIWTKAGNKWTMKNAEPWIRWNRETLTGTIIREVVNEDTYVEEGSFKGKDIEGTFRVKATRVK